MKKLIPLALAVPLILAGCASNDAPTPPPEASTTVPSSPAPSGPVEVQLGETITLTQDVAGPRIAHLTIDDISVSEGCHHGQADHSDNPNDGGYYIQMSGSMESVEGERGYSLSHTWMTGTTPDGYAVEFTPAFSCERPDSAMDGYQNFDSQVIPGQKARGVLEFWASDLPETITLMEPYEPNDYTWQVPQGSTGEQGGAQGPAPAEASTLTPSAPEASSTPATPAPTPQRAPVIGMTEAPGAAQPSAMNKTVESCATDPMMYQPGTTFFMDGTSGWTQQCADQMTQ